MKKQYVSPELQAFLICSDEIMKTSEEAFDINVSFDDLWNSTNL